MSDTSNTRVLRHSVFRMSLRTEIVIDVSPKRIWEVLTDFPCYQYWNASIPQAIGEAIEGSELNVIIKWPGMKQNPYKLKVLSAVKERELRWIGHLGKNGLMDGDHSFVIEPILDERSRLIQAEQFSGWLVPLFAPWLKRNILCGFEQMNQALKNRAEGYTT